jgi:hypothetical protein
LIITGKITIKVNNKNINHLIKQGLDVVYGEKYEIDVALLSKKSKYKILAKCESCEKTNELTYQKYNENWERSKSYNCKACNNITLRKTMVEKYGSDNPSKIESCNEKRKKTCLEKYSNEYSIASDNVRLKIKNTLIDRFGGHQTNDKNILKNIIEKGKNTKIKNGIILPDDELSNWLLYRRLVRRITERNRKDLLINWDGIDYYDNENIADNFKLKHIDLNYPTLDHKISIIHGFRNNIPPYIIGDIDNLCFTKRYINSKKSFLTQEEFVLKFSL